MTKSEKNKIFDFYAQKDENGITNSEKIKTRAKVIRRVAATDKSKSYEEAECVEESGYPLGMVVENGKLIGLGIHIFNEDVYPLQSFEIYLRGCELTGQLDLTESRDMVFLDLYNNRIRSVDIGSMPAMRILGLQNNEIDALDVRGLPACQGIDAGKNRLESLDVSQNPELVELYINDNRFTEIDLTHNAKLKYFYCHNNGITRLDTRQNSLLRHLDATGNPMKEIRCLAPQREGAFPLELTASDGGCVGLKFNPVYNAQWKETGQWQQSYYAYPDGGKSFAGWYDENGRCVSAEAVWSDSYGASRLLRAEFE